MVYIVGVNEDKHLSKSATVDISQLFASLSFINIEEVSLTGVLPVNEVHLPRWNSKSNTQSTVAELFGSSNSFVVTLNPMDVKTFVLTLN